jgi:dolichol-phosphate mannosyltransferase
MISAVAMPTNPDKTVIASAPHSVVTRPTISVLVPVYNEQENIPLLLTRLFDVLEGARQSFEIVAVNDGSRDQSSAVLKEWAARRPELKVVDFRRNFGQTAAIMAAIDHSKGEILVPIDADMQNDPGDVPRLVEKISEGFDVVSGWRKDRKDAPIKRNFVSRIANACISRVSGVHLHDYGCTLKAYRREVITGARLYGEMHRFIPIYATWMGARVTEMPVRHHPRKFGKSNYGLERIFKVMLDLTVVMFLHRYFVKPIYVFGGFGIFSFALSAASFIWMLYLKFFEGTSMSRTPLPLLTTLTILIGFISILMGLLAEMLVRIYFESQGRAAYVVRETVNIS